VVLLNFLQQSQAVWLVFTLRSGSLTRKNLRRVLLLVTIEGRTFSEEMEDFPREATFRFCIPVLRCCEEYKGAIQRCSILLTKVMQRVLK
jgi:hypothetical protein